MATAKFICTQHTQSGKAAMEEERSFEFMHFVRGSIYAHVCMCLQHIWYACILVCGYTWAACVCVRGCVHVCRYSVLYASEPVPAGIRKVDLGHKYLISVCCPWKSSIYSWPNGKMPLSDPFPSLTDKKKRNVTRSSSERGLNLVWMKWHGDSCWR